MDHKFLILTITYGYMIIKNIRPLLTCVKIVDSLNNIILLNIDVKQNHEIRSTEVHRQMLCLKCKIKNSKWSSILSMYFWMGFALN